MQLPERCVCVLPGGGGYFCVDSFICMKNSHARKISLCWMNLQVLAEAQKQSQKEIEKSDTVSKLQSSVIDIHTTSISLLIKYDDT